MLSIFWGLFFIFLNFTITFYSPTSYSTIDLLPDFVGYILILIGSLKFRTISKSFHAMVIPSIVMIPISAIAFILGLTGATLYPNLLTGLLLPIVVLGANVLLIVLCVKGVKDVERSYMLDLKSHNMQKALIALLISVGIMVIAVVSGFVSMITYTNAFIAFAWVISLIAVIAVFVTFIIFIVRFYRVSKTINMHINNQSIPQEMTYAQQQPELETNEEIRYVSPDEIAVNSNDYDDEDE